ncbi:hypothetical protein [Streptomyces bluensis]|uniref:Uncharacterized protein n=1 Tax=Streptomyces bluensis TaxID=33897 RepID=A0ABW6UVC5_9ACTN
MSETPKTERNVCPDCQAGPDPANACVGVGLPMETWHTPDCPTWTIMQINFEAGTTGSWSRMRGPKASSRPHMSA